MNISSLILEYVFLYKMSQWGHMFEIYRFFTASQKYIYIVYTYTIYKATTCSAYVCAWIWAAYQFGGFRLHHKSCLLKCLSLLKLELTFGTYNTLNTKRF